MTVQITHARDALPHPGPHRLVALLLGCLLAVAGCTVQRVTPATADPSTDDPSDSGREVATSEGQEAVPPEGGDVADGREAVTQDEDDRGVAQPLTFGMPDFPGSVTDTTIADLLREACGTPEPCVDWELREEPSDTVPRGRIIRTEPPAGASVTAGDTVIIVRSAGPAADPDSDEGDPDDGDGGVEGQGAPDEGGSGPPRGDGDPGGRGDPAQGDGDPGGGDPAPGDGNVDNPEGDPDEG